MWNSSRNALTIAIALAGVSGTRPAGAHHAAQEQSVGHVRPRTFVAFDFDAAGFDLAGQSGTHYTFALRGEYAPLPYLSGGVRLPTHLLKLDGGSLRAGFGDIDVALKVRLVRTHEGGFLLSTGISCEIPTGDHGEGIGSGHVELSPFVAAMGRLGRLRLHGTLAISVSLVGDEHHHEHSAHEHAAINFINPHESLELVYHVGAIYWFAEWLYSNGVVAANTIVSHDHRGTTFLTLRPEVGVFLVKRWQLALHGQFPVTTDQRISWSVGTTAAVQFW